ncbi:MAG: hypothetical protein COB36_04840 [Alphaproteobacteria bacterium]|nr:MAG: hypothetical protein COB36_04840 [Alphaproteobacteria bacterium]
MADAIADTANTVKNVGSSIMSKAWTGAKIAATAYGALRLYGAFATGGTSAFAELAGEAVVGLTEAVSDLTGATAWVSGKLGTAAAALPVPVAP